MDSITQGVLGAAVGAAILGKKTGQRGAATGAVIATVPDLDIVLYLFYDKYEMLSIHRGLSHSIIFSILGGFLVAIILSKLKWFHGIKFRTLILYSWLCLFTHIILDAFTAYGTQLFLLFSNSRVGFDSINVVDPVYTAPLIIGLFFSVCDFTSYTSKFRFNNYGLILSSIYLIFTLINKQNVKTEISKILSEENIEYSDLLTIPVGIANLNWYGVAKGKDSIYMMKYYIFSSENSSIDRFAINENYLNQIDKKIADKMRWFAKGFYTVDNVNEKIRLFNLQVDMRGIVTYQNKKAPTRGYFEFSVENGKTTFSSGSLKSDK